MNHSEQEEQVENAICKSLPHYISSFVDTFVDFSASGGFFLLPPPQTSDPEASTSSPGNQTAVLRTRYPPTSRLVAIGDLHGDLEKSKQALKLAGLIDGRDRWVGGTTTVVQVGDVLDRGGEELKILYFFEKLKREAEKAGGRVVTMNGNHEIMNVAGDFRYVTKSGLEEFKSWADWFCVGNQMKELCEELPKPKDIYEGIPSSLIGFNGEISSGIRARIAALRPSGPISRRFLSPNLTVLVVGESVFVHGGLLVKHVGYGLERINEEVRDWINGSKGNAPPGYLSGRNSLVWLRKFSNELEAHCDCSVLEHVLATIPGAKRMIMGHTIQETGINGVCNNQAIRVDVGLSKGCINGVPEVLEIKENSELRVLTSDPLYQKRNKSFMEADRKEGLGFLLQQHSPQQVEGKA